VEEVIETPLPAVIAAQKGLNEPRYASLPGIMKAKRKEIKKIDLAASGLDAGEVGEKGSKLKTKNYRLPPERKAGRKIEGEPAETAAEVARLLREEAKLI
ncbi:MAG: electron transfer flavoprotein subunit beta, partial [Candidatus Zixiibacteriota bacterium]